MITPSAASRPASATPTPAAAPAPVAASLRPEPVHEIATARSSMTPTTNALVGDTALGFQWGRQSLAGILNDTVRFRVEGDGKMTERRLVADSAAAQAILDSSAGPKLIKQLDAAKNSLRGLEDRQNLRVFVLPKDVDGVVAASLLDRAEQGERPVKQLFQALNDETMRKDPMFRQIAQAQRAQVNGQYRAGVAAWNQGGGIIFRPDVARAMLTAAGAFKPGKDANIVVKSATEGAEMVNHVPTHEAQHSATPVSDAFYSTKAKWLEEAVAETLSSTHQVLERTATKTGVNRFTYAGHMAHEPAVDLGWKDWKPQKRSQAEQEKNKQEVGRNYERSQDTLRTLLGFTGYGFDSAKELARTKRFLQAAPVESLTDRLAAKLVKAWDIDPKRQAELSKRIGSVIDDKGGMPKLQLDFGIGL